MFRKVRVGIYNTPGCLWFRIQSDLTGHFGYTGSLIFFLKKGPDKKGSGLIIIILKADQLHAKTPGMFIGRFNS